jgi:hypothetical protein
MVGRVSSSKIRNIEVRRIWSKLYLIKCY